MSGPVDGSSPHSAADLVGRTVGRYRLHRRIGEGGMGVVYLGLGPDQRAVAIKVLRGHIAGDPEARRRLTREVETLRRVRHSRVAQVLDADVDGALPFLATEFVDGDGLEEHVRHRGGLTGVDLARIGFGLGDALAAIHRAGVVHRDLKPGNVLVVNGEPIVIDFGIAHAVEDSRLTMTGLVMGTPGYLSPELLEGGTVDRATDWWGWAATVAFAATGRAPFGRGPMEVVLDRVRRGEADLDGVPLVLVPALRAALSPEPARRPRPGELRHALSQLDGAALVPRTAEEMTQNGTDRHASATIVLPGGAEAAGGGQTHAQTVTAAAHRPAVPATVLNATSVGPTRPVPAAATRAQPVLEATLAVSRPEPTRLAPAGTAASAGSAATTVGGDPARPSTPTWRPAARQEAPQPVPQPSRQHAPQAPAPPQQAWVPRSAPPPMQQQPIRQPMQQPPIRQPMQQPAIRQPMQQPPARQPVPPQPARQPMQPVHQHPVQQPVQQNGRTEQPERSRSRRTGTFLAALVVLIIAGVTAPLLTLIGFAMLSAVARMVDRVSWGLMVRRHHRGRRRSDPVIAVASSPWHLLIGALLTVLAMALPLALGVSAYFAFGLFWPLTDASYAGLPPLAAAFAALALASWWGPGGRSLRTGSRSLVRTLTPGRAGSVIAVALVLLAGVAAMSVLARGGWTPDWYPLAMSPLEHAIGTAAARP